LTLLNLPQNLQITRSGSCFSK